MTILPSFQDLWARLTEGDESVLIEAKRASEVGRSIWETISAFSNEPDAGGGYFLFGVAVKSGSLFPDYEVVGIPDADKVQRDLATQCRENFSSPIRPQIAIEVHNGKRVIVAFIPEADPRDKPLYISTKGPAKGAYRRIGSTDQVCTDDDIAIFYQSRGHHSFDETVLNDTTLDDVEPQAVVAYRNARTVSGDESAMDLLRLGDEDLLYAVNATTPVDGRPRLTVAGLMLFGRQASIRRHMPMTRVDYVRVEGREWIQDSGNRYQGIERTGPLLLIVPQIIGQVMEDIPNAFSLREGGIYRRDVPLVPNVVIREAVVNAFMHRNYRVHQPIQIIRFANRIEIRNPGYSLIPEDRLGEPGSKTRNPKIAAVLHDAKLAETKGTGIRVMRQGMDQANLTAPLIDSDRVRDEFILGLLAHHLLGEKDVEWLRGFKDCNLCPDDARALVVLREVGTMDNARYRSINRVDALTASNRLRNLRDQGLLEQHGKSASTYYSEGPRIFQRQNTRAPRKAVQKETMRPGHKSLRPGLEALRPGFEAMARELPEGLKHALDGLGRRAKPADLNETIYRLCCWRPMSIEELAFLLERDGDHLQKRNVRRLMVEKKLGYLFPEQESHPKQKYVPIDDGAA